MRVWRSNAHPLKRRKRSLLRDLTAELKGETDVEKVKSLQTQLEAVEDVLSRIRRRNALVWAVRAFVVLLVGLLGLSKLSRATATLHIAARASGAVVNAGQVSENIVPQSAALTRAEIFTATEERCLTVESNVGNCGSVQRLHLNSLTVYKNASIALERRSACVFVSLVSGGADALFTSSPDGGVSAPGKAWTTTHVTLKPSDFLKICPEGEAAIRFTQPSGVLIGYQTMLGPGDLLVTPAIDDGIISIEDTGRTRAVGRADVIRVGNFRQGGFFVRVADTLAMTVSGTVKFGSVSYGSVSVERNLVPTWFDWLWNSPAVKLVVGIIGAVFAFVMTVRERVLVES